MYGLSYRYDGFFYWITSELYDMSKADEYTSRYLVQVIVMSIIVGALFTVEPVLGGFAGFVGSLYAVQLIFSNVETMTREIVEEELQTESQVANKVEEERIDSSQRVSTAKITQGDTELYVENSDEGDEVLLEVGNPADAARIDVIVDGEMRHSFKSPDRGDRARVKKKDDESINAKIIRRQ